MQEIDRVSVERQQKGGAVRFVLALTALVIAVIVAAQNADVVTVSLFAWRFEASLAIVIVLCFTLGALMAALVLLPRLYRGRSLERRLSARISELEARDRAAPADVPSQAGGKRT